MKSELTPKRLVFIGPQGSGKGTQAAVFAARLGLPNISTGVLFREHLERQTDLGKQAQGRIEAGQLVPDEITNAMLAERLEQSDAADGCVLDGYPRNLVQAQFLDGIASPDRVIEIQLADDDAVRRISRRRTDRDTGAIVSLDLLTDEQRQYYQSHPDRLVQRGDDQPVAVRERLKIYRQTTEPILTYYRQQGKLVTVDGAPLIDQVTKTINSALGLPPLGS